MGSKQDSLVVMFVEPELFISQETGIPLAPGVFISKTIPKQFPDEDSYAMAIIAGSTV